MTLGANPSRRRDVRRAAMPVALALFVASLFVSLIPPDTATGQVLARHLPTGAPSSGAGRARLSPVPPMASPVMSGSDPPYAVLTSSVRFFDPSRTTGARGTVPATQGRVLVTDLFVPVGASGPRPLVVFAHGWNSDPGVYASLLEEWAAAGFVVAAPVFPDSTDLYPGSPVSDYADQALDITFVISSLLHDQAVAIDPKRIAVTGHSDGGTDVALMALDPAYADARVRAYVCMSGEMPSGVAAYDVADDIGRGAVRRRVGRRVRPVPVDDPGVPDGAGVRQGHARRARRRPPRLLRGRDARRRGHARRRDAVPGAGARTTDADVGGDRRRAGRSRRGVAPGRARVLKDPVQQVDEAAE